MTWTRTEIQSFKIKKHTFFKNLVKVHCIYFRTVQAQADEKHTTNVMTYGHKRAHCNNSSAFKVQFKTLDVISKRLLLHFVSSIHKIYLHRFVKLFHSLQAQMQNILFSVLKPWTAWYIQSAGCFCIWISDLFKLKVNAVIDSWQLHPSHLK